MMRSQEFSGYAVGLTDADLEEAGGWRVFMRAAVDRPMIPQAVTDMTRLRRYPRAGLGRAFILAKTGHLFEARRQFELCEAALGEDFDEDLHLEIDRRLVATHISVYEDKTLDSEDGYVMRRVLSQVPDHDVIGQALACNHLCTICLHLGDFDRAQEYAEQSIRLFRNDGAEFGSLHLRTHLGQIKMMRGDLLGAEEQYREMEERLSVLPGNPGWLIAVGRVLWAEVAYERNDLDTARRMMAQAQDSVEEKDAWFDVLAAAYRVRTRLAYAASGLPGALTELSHAEHVARERGMPRLERLMKIERIRALTLSDELDGALRMMEEIGLSRARMTWDDGDDWALRQGTAFVAIARWLVRARRSRQALEFIEPAEDFAIRGGQLLSLAKLRVVKSAAYWKQGVRSAATGSLLSAIRLLGRQPFRRFILDEGREMQAIVQAALDGDHVTVPPTPEQRRRLSELTHFWAIGETTHPGGHAAAGGVGESAGALPRRYLQLVALGHSNKEIARIMGVTVNTVKYHLKQIFREMHVDNRMQAVRRAHDLGLIDG